MIQWFQLVLLKTTPEGSEGGSASAEKRTMVKVCQCMGKAHAGTGNVEPV